MIAAIAVRLIIGHVAETYAPEYDLRFTKKPGVDRICVNGKLLFPEFDVFRPRGQCLPLICLSRVVLNRSHHYAEFLNDGFGS